MRSAQEERPIVCVAGLARCGTTMTMQMLAAGGVLPMAGTDPASFECEALMLPWKHGVVARLAPGRAVKIVDPLSAHKSGSRLPPGVWRFIWLDRDANEQARSILKLLGMPDVREDRRGMKASLIRDRGPSLKLLRSWGAVLVCSFEAILLDPEREAYRIASFLRPDFTLTVDAAAAVVISRGPMCRPDMAIELQLIESLGA